ncbi:lysozyme inhibitor LprI family protein [Pseudomonas gingeri]|uniref:lysozyme inhibitor LprI family protein n=1 Tax=Pseudomonas gingeri TaxID=117681 RepID=UPI0015A35068|nr:lysozyme inhibitor LprI family protein [Pseudomonas gingeri]NVZ99154.1 DUF1311 domain-containing protein [Pseudomonas gingeri]NWA13199.1 DUF1311 domain-containing protein [Pseudomonas gingeri]NWA55460.1 DUF1311 domain-containing protein [Pseudomonas gingeri]NWA95686.1 DUF1311 domain-containing protein [Pseudomonas gingeri]NWB00773.1 DUF1311 domain-containing protein [Pseudomonas gingeri]
MSDFAAYKKTLAIMLIGLSGCMHAVADDKPCSTQNSSIGIAQCKAEKLKDLNAVLDAHYRDALNKLPEVGSEDVRKTKEQLKKAQSAWQVYRDENCSYVGGLQGGSSMWVTIFSVDCVLEETERRIEFFKNLPVGG